MAILTPEHLFAQAESLIALFPKRKPRQTELRRAISAAYYGIYHFVLKQAADEYVGARYGKAFPPAPQYSLAYRSISHTVIYALCADIKKPIPPGRLQPYGEAGRFSANLRSFSTLFVDLQDGRHTADYDMSVTINRAQAMSAITLARKAVECFRSLAKQERGVFLALLLFPPRGR